MLRRKSIIIPKPSIIIPTLPALKRSDTIPFDQVINDCLVKSHAKLLSNYFCNILRINDPKVINKMSANFNLLLSTYSVNEIDEITGKKTTVKGYGGYISDVLGKIIIDINEKNKNKNVSAIKRLLKIFTKDQIKYLRDTNIAVPEIIIEDNTANGTVVMPGAQNFITAIDEFIRFARKHQDDTTKFVTYFAIEFLLTPCFFYWMATLDNITDQNDPNGYIPDSDLLTGIQLELRGVRWDGEKYVNDSDQNADILRGYLTSIGRDPNEADNYKGYPGHSSIIKGVGIYNMEDCLLMQNSWNITWNAKFCGSRPISRNVLNMVVYGVIQIAPDPIGFGITKRRRPNKTNKNKKKPKSPKKGTRKRI